MLAHRDLRGRWHRDVGRAHEVFQTSTIDALMAGDYDGELTVGELLEHGDFGVGTFDGLDGEIVVLDGTCYRLRADGSAEVARREEHTPLAAVTRFVPDATTHRTGPTDRDALCQGFSITVGPDPFPGEDRGCHRSVMAISPTSRGAPAVGGVGVVAATIGTDPSRRRGKFARLSAARGVLGRAPALLEVLDCMLQTGSAATEDLLQSPPEPRRHLGASVMTD